MFNLEQSIAEWRRQMLAAGIKSPVPLEELESHLREEIGKQIRSGRNEPLALEIALGRIGQANALNNEFKKAEGLKEAARGAAKSLFNVALLALPVIVLVSTICLVNAWQGPVSRSFSVLTPYTHMFSGFAGENAPASLEMNLLNNSHGAGNLLKIYNQFAGGRFAGRPWWFQSVCIMEVLLFSLILPFAAYFQTPKNMEDSRRQRHIVWIGQLLLGFSGLFAVFSPDPFFWLVMAVIICTGLVSGLRWQRHAAIMAS